MVVIWPVAWLTLLLLLLECCLSHTFLPGSQLQAAINAAINSHQAGLTIVNNYTFANSGLLLAGATSFRFNASANIALSFDCGFGFQIANSTDVTINSLVIRYTKPCFAQASRQLPRWLFH